MLNDLYSASGALGTLARFLKITKSEMSQRRGLLLYLCALIYCHEKDGHPY